MGSDQAVVGTGNAERIERAVAVRKVLVVGKPVRVPVRAVEGRLVWDRGPRYYVGTPGGQARPHGEGQAMLKGVLESGQQSASIGCVGEVCPAFRASETCARVLMVLMRGRHEKTGVFVGEEHAGKAFVSSASIPLLYYRTGS